MLGSEPYVLTHTYLFDTFIIHIFLHIYLHTVLNGIVFGLIYLQLSSWDSVRNNQPTVLMDLQMLRVLAPFANECMTPLLNQIICALESQGNRLRHLKNCLQKQSFEIRVCSTGYWITEGFLKKQLNVCLKTISCFR